MTDNKLVKGDICIYHYADGNGSVNIVEVVEVINSDLSKIKCIQVICDKSGNGWFEYMFQKGITMTASNEYLHKIDFINRQKAEIEMLNGSVKSLEELCETKTTLITDANWSLITARAKAIKEFAERLKREVYTEKGFSVFSDDTIDNLVKEMVGE